MYISLSIYIYIYTCMITYYVEDDISSKTFPGMLTLYTIHEAQRVCYTSFCLHI